MTCFYMPTKSPRRLLLLILIIIIYYWVGKGKERKEREIEINKSIMKIKYHKKFITMYHRS
jgi:hypothetical protein